jgi:hypothetical protein
LQGVAAEIQDSDFLSEKKYIYWDIFGKNPAGSWNIHIFLVPTQIFSAIAFICAEKMSSNQNLPEGE